MRLFNPNTLSHFVSRYYWLQIALIALAVLLGVLSSAFIMKGLLLKAAMEQEAAHYWQRYDADANAPLPDTKNLYGYRWQNTPPEAIAAYRFDEKGVRPMFIDGKKRTVVYDEYQGQKLLLVFGESNVNRIVWLFGVTPLILSLVLLYSVLWYFNQKAQILVSPVERLARAIQNIDLRANQLVDKPFERIDTANNIEAQHLKKALAHYHQTLIQFIRRERLFTREVSHELRTPLSVIKGSLQVLEAQFGDVASAKATQRMHNTINDMQLIIDTLLTIAREGSQEIERPVQPLEPILQRVVNDLTPLAAQRNMHITQDVSAPCVSAINDTIAYMIVSNIVRNALNYSQGTFVRITLDARGIEIIDDGIGLPEEAVAALQQTDDAHPKSVVPIKGHGIGLKLVKRLCQLLNWQMVIETRATESGRSGLSVRLMVEPQV